MIVLQFLRETNNTVMILGEIKPYISYTSAKDSVDIGRFWFM